MKDYCTLFNMTYAAKGMALYESLARHSKEEFRLWVLAMDERTYDFLYNNDHMWPHMIVLHGDAIMNYKFREATEGRDIAYTCFTATPCLMSYLINTEGLDEVTYLDSDLCFYADPAHAHQEIGSQSVGIVPHRFLDHDVDRLSPNGWYNVSWVTIKNDKVGAPILARWRAQCLEKCDRESCGDQTYLNEWPNMFGATTPVCVLHSHGIGVAPWNAMRYRVLPGPRLFSGVDFGTVEWPFVFYHFHELKRRGPGDYFLTGYKLPTSFQEIIYKPYIAQLEMNEAVVEEYLKGTGCA